MSRLLIVSNRLPVTVTRSDGDFIVSPSAGGLATGLRGPHQRSGALWIGWPGDLPRLSKEERAVLEERLAAVGTAPVYLTQSEVRRYYEGFANGVLWPLFHYLTDKVQPDEGENWLAYTEANQRFAEAVAAHYRRGDVVWVHDYQLALVPVLLRQILPEARIGFFLHIPFPSSDVFRVLPWRTEMLEGILGADLVGFHTYSYLRHFSRALNLILRVEVTGNKLQYANRDIRLGVFPMGIDAGHFERMAETAPVLEEVASIRRDLGGRKLLLGIDRLDYTKGLPHRIMAVDRLIEREPSLRGKIRFVQVVVPSRTKVESYRNYRQELDGLVGHVNSRHATIHSVLIHYLYHSISQEQLVAFYRAADVMLVTPLRDGMNLVAKEFVATRTDDSGVLVLSEFAGAASELAEALQVNPYDTDATATAILAALSMPEEERRTRMQALRRRVATYDSYRWAESFLAALDAARPRTATRAGRVSSPQTLARVAEQLRGAWGRVLLLDYDGTLVPYATSPQLAAPDAELLDLLKALAAHPRTVVHLISGRPPDVIQRWFGSLPITLHAEHGFWSRFYPGGWWLPLHAEAPGWKEKVAPILNDALRTTPGSFLEEKTAAMAWHYGMADPEFGERKAAELTRRLLRDLKELGVDLVPGDRVLEVRMAGTHKGVIAERIGLEPADGMGVLAMGDHRTDEELFAVLPPGSVTVHVGSRPSKAAYRVSGPAEARALLRMLLDERAESTMERAETRGQEVGSGGPAEARE